MKLWWNHHNLQQMMQWFLHLWFLVGPLVLLLCPYPTTLYCQAFWLPATHIVGLSSSLPLSTSFSNVAWFHSHDATLTALDMSTSRSKSSSNNINNNNNMDNNFADPKQDVNYTKDDNSDQDSLFDSSVDLMDDPESDQETPFDEHGYDSSYSGDPEGDTKEREMFMARNPEWLDAETNEVLDREQFPLGQLTPDDVEYMTSLMVAWSRRWSSESPIRLETLLKRVVDDLKAGNNKEIHVHTVMYTAAMEAWSKSGTAGRAERAQHIHNALLRQYQRLKDPNLQPTLSSFNTLINVWAKSGEPEATQQVEVALQQMLDSGLQPDAVTISSILDTYSRARGPNLNVSRCEEIFRLADEEWNVTKTLYTYSTLQTVHARSESSNGVRKALEILDTMWDRFHAGDVLVKPSAINYNAILNAASRNPTQENAALAVQVLRRMELPPSKGGDDVEPDRLSYALTILTCSRCKDPRSGTHTAEAALERMEARAEMEEKRRQQVSSAAPPVVRLDVECYNVVLTSLSRCIDKNMVNRMRTIIDRMEKLVEKGNASVRPNIRTWNALLNGMARSSRIREVDYSDEAEMLLYRLFELHRQGQKDVMPNAFSFAAVLTTFQRSQDLASVTDRADRTLRLMEGYHQKGLIEHAPDVYHYTILCGVWSRSRLSGASNRCMQILAHMLERHDQGFPNVLPNVRTYNACLDCFARSHQPERAEHLLFHMLNLARKGQKAAAPDEFSFNSVIHAFSQSFERGAGRRAESILDRFLEYSEQEDPSTKPDSRSFTKIIGYYGRMRKPTVRGTKHNDSPYRAEYVLNRMIALFREGHNKLAPTDWTCITTVMDCYSFAKHPDAGRNAERLLKLARELEMHPACRLKIDRNVMNSVLYAWASCGDPNAGTHGSSHLQFMEKAYKNGNKLLAPTSRSYSLVLSSWSTSSSPDKARRSLETINAMKLQIKDGNKDVVLDEHHYALAINACAFANANVEAEKDAFGIAVTLLDEILESDILKMTSVTYGWFIQCCGRLRVPELVRNAHLERVFHQCCEDGLVNDFVVWRLQGAAPDDLFDKLMAPATGFTGRAFKGKIKRSHLPPNWTRNTAKQKWLRN